MSDLLETEQTNPVLVLVTGSRTLEDKDLDMATFFDQFVQEGVAYKLIHGAARGADSLAAKEAKRRNFQVVGYPANWKQYGKRAGPLRSAEMVNQCPQIVIGFIKGDSVGTRTCLKMVAKSNSVKNIFLWHEGKQSCLSTAELATYLAK